MDFMLLGASAAEFCRETARIWGVVGYVVLVLKIVIPLVLIVLGMVDLGKAVVGSKDDEINKAVNMLLHRFIAAVIVFFVPTIVSALFNALLGVDMGPDSGVNQCVQCVTNVTSSKVDCTTGVGIDTTY